MSRAIETFPPRPLTYGEREILHTWSAAADDVFAFVSERRSDDPTIYRQIVISRLSTGQRLYLICPPQGHDFWLVLCATEGEDVARCPTLRSALNFVRTVRPASPREQMRLSNSAAG